MGHQACQACLIDKSSKWMGHVYQIYSYFNLPEGFLNSGDATFFFPISTCSFFFSETGIIVSMEIVESLGYSSLVQLMTQLKMNHDVEYK